ncbi:MAG: DUF892 family protein [Pseudomonadota bacterium]|nr:DUF892 family protein [Pseudomonadota bacterium]
MGGVKVYETALKCAVHENLRDEWQKYLEETRHHVEVLETLCKTVGVDPETDTTGCQVVRHLGAALVQAMEMALAGGDPAAAQLVACECVVLAETKDHADWELIGQCAKHWSGKEADALLNAYEEIEGEEDSHLYHSKGWCRELWIESLGLDAVLPPPEEQLKVKTAIGAARAQASVRAARPVGATKPTAAR